MVAGYQYAFSFRIRPLNVLISFDDDFEIEMRPILGECVQKQKEHDLIRPVKVFDRLFLVGGGVNEEWYCCACQQQRSLKTMVPRHDLHRQGETTFSRTNEMSHGRVVY